MSISVELSMDHEFYPCFKIEGELLKKYAKMTEVFPFFKKDGDLSYEFRCYLGLGFLLWSFDDPLPDKNRLHWVNHKRCEELFWFVVHCSEDVHLSFAMTINIQTHDKDVDEFWNFDLKKSLLNYRTYIPEHYDEGLYIIYDTEDITRNCVSEIINEKSL